MQMMQQQHKLAQMYQLRRQQLMQQQQQWWAEQGLSGPTGLAPDLLNMNAEYGQNQGMGAGLDVGMR